MGLDQGYAAEDTYIPVIDMKEMKAELGEKMVKAWEDWGCFRVVNHGISSSLMYEMKEVGESLLELPLEVKLKNAYPDHSSMGYIPLHAASHLYEGLGVFDASLPDAIDAFSAQLNASPAQRETITKYCQAVHDLANLVGCKVKEGLGLGSGPMFTDWSCLLKINKNHNGADTLGSLAATEHSDQGFLTILMDDEVVNGLDIVDKTTGKWISVDPLPGSFLVNAGDIAKVWSNGRFYNVKHRVRSLSPRVRYSNAYFVLGPRDGKVEAPLEMVDEAHPLLYKPFRFQEYTALRTSTRSPMGTVLDQFFRAVA